MFKVSQLISLPVINIFKIKIEGYIEKACFNTEKKSLEYLKIYNEQEDIYKSLKFSNILKITDTAVFIRNSSKITLYENDEYLYERLISPINAKAYILNGEHVGLVQDVEIMTNGQVAYLLINDTNYTSRQVVGMDNGLVLVSDDKKVNINRYKPTSKKIKSTITTLESEPVVTILQKPSITPQREITNYNFLLNRRILKDIKNQSGEIIAHQNTLVSVNTINKLKYYGKLKELTLNSR